MVVDCKMELYEFAVDLHKMCLRVFDTCWQTMQSELREALDLSVERDCKNKKLAGGKLEVHKQRTNKQHNYLVVERRKFEVAEWQHRPRADIPTDIVGKVHMTGKTEICKMSTFRSTTSSRVCMAGQLSNKSRRV